MLFEVLFIYKIGGSNLNFNTNHPNLSEIISWTKIKLSLDYYNLKCKSIIKPYMGWGEVLFKLKFKTKTYLDKIELKLILKSLNCEFVFESKIK